MRKLFYLLFGLLFIACTSYSDDLIPPEDQISQTDPKDEQTVEQTDENDSEEEQTNDTDSQEKILLLTKIIEKDNLYNNEVIQEFIYESGLLTKTTISNSKHTYESFEYDTEGNINKVNYYAPHYDTNEIQLLAEITITEKNNQIIRHDAHDNVTVIYTLNEENQVVKRECETCETLFMQYEEGKVSKLIVHSSDGSFAGESSYEYDIGINPINVLFKKFRFLENYQTNFLDYTMEYYLTNLVTKEYDENGEVKFISTYEKNEFGYPTHAYWRAPKIGESGIATFEYLTN